MGRHMADRGLSAIPDSGAADRAASVPAAHAPGKGTDLWTQRGACAWRGCQGEAERITTRRAGATQDEIGRAHV